jgi:hypothetical protein
VRGTPASHSLSRSAARERAEKRQAVAKRFTKRRFSEAERLIWHAQPRIRSAHFDHIRGNYGACIICKEYQMHRTLIALALLGVSTAAASSVQAQSVPLAGNGASTSTMNYAAIGSTWTPSAEEAYIKDAIRGAGYSGVNSLERDSDGIWHARAYKGQADVLVAVDRSGHISEMRQNGQNLN